MGEPLDRGEVAALSALYQAERSDVSLMQQVNAAVFGLAVAYAGATVAFLTPEKLQSINPRIISFLPLPLWIAAVFLGVFSGAQERRKLSSIFLQRELVAITRLGENEIRAVELTNSHKIKMFAKAGILITFSGDAAVTISYSCIMLYWTHTQDPELAVLLTPAVIYVALVGFLAATLIANKRDVRERARKAGIPI